MVKECRTWRAAVHVKSDTGTRRLDVIVAANDFDSAVGLLRRAWPTGDVQSLESVFYEAIVSGD